MRKKDDSAERIAALLEGIVRRQRRASWEQLGALDVTPAQVRVLRTLHHAGAAIRVSDLAARLGIVPRSATSVVDDLETAGLVRRAADPGDRRATLVSMTAKGARVLAAVRRSKRDATVALVERLDRSEREQLLSLLARLAPDDAVEDR
ncbi:MarR family winged helix-turn-helix transcriptional regulator [Actinopolymorpha alba]|uniref:MarR family winged helix-turn-helix transcriptional regulator n=1 Tax=Actinopolymorpha alba TaxID=533267 RepID=UPI00037A878A|nr:MarR family transcriptional regulator [Actinopolymorpha alba]